MALGNNYSASTGKIEHMFLEEGRSVSISRNQDTMTCL